MNVEIGMMIKCNTPMINVISVNNVNLVIQQQIASGKHYCISLTKALINVEIGVMVKLKDQHCDKISVNHVNHVKNCLRQVLPYLTNRSSTKFGNWCDGKV